MKPRSRFRELTLFVTVGSTRFDELVQKILTEEFASKISSLGFSRLIVQTGQSEYDQATLETVGKNSRLEFEVYDYKPSIVEDIEAADLVIGHAGAGTCLEVLRLNKQLLVVVNESLMDNHQCELADELAKNKFVVKTTVEQLSRSLDNISDGTTELTQFPPKDQSKFEEIFDEALKRAGSRL